MVRKDQLQYGSTQLGFVPEDSYLIKSILREDEKLGANHTVKLSRSIWHQIKIRERICPSHGVLQKCAPHERSLCTPRFEERSHEDTLHQEGRARRAAWDLAKICTSPRMRTEQRFILLLKPGQCGRPEERELVVDSGASMHMLSKKDLSSDELDTLRRSRNPLWWLTPMGKWRIRSRSWSPQHSAITRRNACSSITWKTLRRPPGIPTSGSAVKNHSWPSRGRHLYAKRTISYLLLFPGCVPILEAFRLLHRHRWTRQVNLQVQYQSELTD